MTNTTWSENDELFIKELKEGHEWQSYPALFFKLHGLKVEMPKLTIRENISEADKWKDSFDFIIEDLPFEHKSRNIEFTCPQDYPYDTVFIDTVKGWDQKAIKPSYIFTSKTTGCMLWLPAMYSEKFTKVTKFDRVRNINEEFYVIDPKYLQHISTLLKKLKRNK